MSRLPNPVQVPDANAERAVHVEEMHATLGDSIPRVEEVRSRINEGATAELKEATDELKKSVQGLLKSLKHVASAARSYVRIRGLPIPHLPLPRMPFGQGKRSASHS